MDIQYREGKSFSAESLVELFLSVNWESGKFPERLQQAMENSSIVISAWDNDRLVGLINCLSDGHMVAYFHYLLVRAEYQKKGVGRGLLARMLDKCRHIRQKVLIAHDPHIGFYKRFGFVVSENYSSMHINEF